MQYTMVLLWSQGQGQSQWQYTESKYDTFHPVPKMHHLIVMVPGLHSKCKKITPFQKHEPMN